MLPKSGDLVHIGRAASVQFALDPFLFRVVRLPPYTTYEGWLWLSGYQLNSEGDAIEMRDIFVKAAGVRFVGNGRIPATRTRRLPGIVA
jgi:hypothetical protein